MNKTTIYISILLLLFTSCKSDNLDEVLKTSRNPELDMVFYTIVKTEFKEIGNSIGIVDKATEKKNHEIVESINKSKKESETVYWNKNIFPRAKYISKDTLDLYSMNEKKYWDFAKKHKTGWIELSEPIFTKNKERVTIEVTFSNPANLFGASSYYILERKGNKYVIIEKQLTSIS